MLRHRPGPIFDLFSGLFLEPFWGPKMVSKQQMKTVEEGSKRREQEKTAGEDSKGRHEERTAEEERRRRQEEKTRFRV